MRRVLALAGVIAVLWAGPVRADDPPHMALVRGLRAEGMADLALEYLNKLDGMDLPKEIKEVLPLERAKTTLEMASQETEDSRRLSKVDEAEVQFKAFKQKSPNHPLIPQVDLELARLEAMRGDAQLAKSRRQEDDKEKQAEAALAQPFYERAAKLLDTAGKAIDKKLESLGEATSPADEAIKTELTRSKYQAMLERGINLFNQSKTTTDNRKISKYVEDARKELEKLTEDEGAENTPQIWSAKAWILRCYIETQQNPEADSMFEIIDKEKSPTAAEAQRLARFFRIRQVIDGEPSAIEKQKESKFAKILRLGTQWLERYRAYRSTYEGTGVVWAMAINFQGEAQRLTVRNKDGKITNISGNGRIYYLNAEKLYKELADGDNEYTDRAARNRMLCILARTYDRKDDIANLQTFDELFRNAQLELYQMGQKLKEPFKAPANLVVKDDAPEAEKEKIAAELAKAEAAFEEDKKTLPERTYAKVIEMIQRGLKKTKPTDSARDIVNANLTLVYALTEKGDLPEAIDLAEKIAKQNLRSGKGVQAASYALRAASKAMAEAREEGRSDDLGKWQTKLKSLASFMEQSFPKESATDLARHQLAALALKEEDQVSACQIYSRITPNYSLYPSIRLEQGLLAYQIASSKSASDEEKKAILTQTIADLNELQLPTTGSSDTLRTAALAKMQLGYLYLLPDFKKYAEAEKLAASVAAQAEKMELDADAKVDVAMSAKTLQTYGQFYQASQLVRDGKIDEAAKLYDPIVDAEAPKEEGKSADRARAARRNMMILALRANVQDGKIERAQAILEKVNTEEQASGLGSSITQTLLAVVNELQGQITDMKRKAGEDAAATEAYQKTVESFAAFLDTIGTRKDVTDDMRIFLAQGYFTLDKFQKASDLLNQIAEPKEEDPAQTKRYRSAQFLLARSYRLDKKYDQAEKLVTQFIGTPEKRGWAFNNLDVRKEKIFLLEDRKQYQNAMTEWQSLQKAFLSWRKLMAKPDALANENDPKRKEAIDLVWGLYSRLFSSWKNLPSLDVDPSVYADDKSRLEAFKELKAAMANETNREIFDVIAQTARTERPRQLAIREVYYEYYYYIIRCIYKSNEKAKDRPAVMGKLAGSIIRFEQGKGNEDYGGAKVRDLFYDLIAGDADLKKAYIAQGGRLFSSPTTTTASN